MKKFLLPLLLVVALQGCMSIFCEKGSGVITEENIDVKEFKNVVLKGSGEVNIIKGDKESCVVKVDDNLMDFVTTEVRNETLILTFNESICPTELVFDITMNDLEKIKIAGSGDFMISGPFVSNEIFLDIEGSGDILCENIDTKILKTKISGSGDIKVNGKAEESYAKIDGSGDINMSELETLKSKITIYGSGSCRVNTEYKLTANIYGSGDVYFKGNPKTINKKIMGSGDLIKMDY